MRRPPSTTRTYTLFPYTARFRSHALAPAARVALDRVAGEQIGALEHVVQGQQHLAQVHRRRQPHAGPVGHERRGRRGIAILAGQGVQVLGGLLEALVLLRSEEHTSEIQSLMRISVAVFVLKKKDTSRPTYTV